MSEKAFCTAVAQLTEAVHEAFKTPRKLPAFILLYTSLDIFASLTRPTTQEDTDGNIFRAWVAMYMLPDSGLACVPMDIWGARCGLLHTFTTESRKSRQGVAKQLQYVGDESIATDLQQKIDPTLSKHVFIDIKQFVGAFLLGLERFTKHIQTDATLLQKVFFHAKSLILHEIL